MERKVESTVKSMVWFRRRWRSTAGLAVGPGSGAEWGGGRSGGGVQVAHWVIVVILLSKLEFYSMACWDWRHRFDANYNNAMEPQRGGGDPQTLLVVHAFSPFWGSKFLNLLYKITGDDDVMDVCSVALHGTKRISFKVSVSGVLWNQQFIGLQNLTFVKTLSLWRSFIGYLIVRTYTVGHITENWSFVKIIVCQLAWKMIAVCPREIFMNSGRFRRQCI